MADPKKTLRPLPTAQLRYQRYSETGRLYESDIVEYLEEVRKIQSKYMSPDDLEDYLEKVEKKARQEAKPYLDREKREKEAAEARRLKQQQKRTSKKIPEKKKVNVDDSVLIVNKKGEVNKVSPEKLEASTSSVKDLGKGVAKGTLNLGVAIFNKMFPTLGAYIKKFTDKDDKSGETYEKISQSSVTINRISETLTKNNEILQQILSVMQRSQQQLGTQQQTSLPGTGQPSPQTGSRQTPPATQAPPAAPRPSAAMPPPPATSRMAPTSATTGTSAATIAGGVVATSSAQSPVASNRQPISVESEEQIFQRLIERIPESSRNDPAVINERRQEARIQFQNNQRTTNNQATRISNSNTFETEEQIFQRLIQSYPQNMRNDVRVINDVREEARMEFQANRRAASQRGSSQRQTPNTPAVSEIAERQQSDGSFASRILNVRAREIAFRANVIDFGQQFAMPGAGIPGSPGTAGSPGAAGAAGSPGAASTPPPPAAGGASSGNLMRPTGGPVTSGFGQRAMGNHQGIDFGVPIGSPIVSSQTGTVVEARTSPSYGNVIRVRGEDGTETLYAHLSSFAVQQGQQVQRGQQLGLSGNTGRSTGPHLHFEAIKDGQKVDPAPLIGAAGEAPKPAASSEASASAAAPAATMEAPSPSSGAQVAQASVQSEVSMMQGQQVNAELGEAPSPSQGASTPTDPSVPNIDPNNPGPVEPADAAQRYARLFNMAA